MLSSMCYAQETALLAKKRDIRTFQLNKYTALCSLRALVRQSAVPIIAVLAHAAERKCLFDNLWYWNSLYVPITVARGAAQARR